jgi:hypothetical protein
VPFVLLEQFQQYPPNFDGAWKSFWSSSERWSNLSKGTAAHECMMELDGSIIMMVMPGRTRQRLHPRAGPSKVHHTARHGQQRPEAQGSRAHTSWDPGSRPPARHDTAGKIITYPFTYSCRFPSLPPPRGPRKPLYQKRPRDYCCDKLVFQGFWW